MPLTMETYLKVKRVVSLFSRLMIIVLEWKIYSQLLINYEILRLESLE